MLASDTFTMEPRQKKSNFIFQSRAHLENFTRAVFVRITQENNFRVQKYKNKPQATKQATKHG
jgi:hypothetical protein